MNETDYEIVIIEKLCKVVKVEATSKMEAIHLVEEQYKNCEHVLDYSHHVDTEFKEL